jgi:hypothetical protein
MSKTFKATHLLCDSDGIANGEELMQVGDAYYPQDVWEQGGRAYTETMLHETGWSVQPIT